MYMDTMTTEAAHQAAERRTLALREAALGTVTMTPAGIAYVVGRVRLARQRYHRAEQAAEAARTCHVVRTERGGDVVPGTTDGTGVTVGMGDGSQPFEALAALATAGDYVDGSGTVHTIRIGKRGRRVGKREHTSAGNGAKGGRPATGHRAMNAAERKAASRRAAAERAARAEGVDVATIEREREAWLGKRAAKDAEGAVLVSQALAVAASSWDTDH